MQFLYDANEFYRFRAAEALGYLCKVRTARNFILLLFWLLSDELGAYCISVPLGIAEIGERIKKCLKVLKVSMFYCLTIGKLRENTWRMAYAEQLELLRMPTQIHCKNLSLIHI